jgi:hypothetical protein
VEVGASQVLVPLVLSGQAEQRVPHDEVASSATQSWPQACAPAAQVHAPLEQVAPPGQSLCSRQPGLQVFATGSQK